MLFRSGRGLTVRPIDEARWHGKLRLGKQRFEYEARAATPLAKTVPGGGMRGFLFDGGTGFTEFGNP